MNIFTQIFGILRQGGLVETVREKKPLTGFITIGAIICIVGGLLYGFTMGIGLSLETAFKDSIKIGLIMGLGLIFSIPMFWISYRLMGRKEPFSQIAMVPLTLELTMALLMAIMAPVVFMLSILAGLSAESIYIHVVIVDLAFLVGIYMSGAFVYHSFTEQRQRLVIPNVLGFIMMIVAIVVMISFLQPYLTPQSSFSVGTDRLKDAIGIGVYEKADQALAAAMSAERITYQFETTNENGDITRRYNISRTGDDYLIRINQHSVPGETTYTDYQIWAINGRYYSDLNDGRIEEISADSLASILEVALPATAFNLAGPLEAGSWRAYSRNNQYTIQTITTNQERLTLDIHPASGRLNAFIFDSTQSGPQAEIRVNNISESLLSHEDLQNSLNIAIVLGNVDRSNPAYKDMIAESAFFVFRYPQNWSAARWNGEQQEGSVSLACGLETGCPQVTISARDLRTGQRPIDYANQYGNALTLQPEYRAIMVTTETINKQTVGVVTYLEDHIVKGEQLTTVHTHYIFAGQRYLYHIDFKTDLSKAAEYHRLFQEMAQQFTYLTADSD